MQGRRRQRGTERKTREGERDGASGGRAGEGQRAEPGGGTCGRNRIGEKEGRPKREAEERGGGTQEGGVS